MELFEFNKEANIYGLNIRLITVNDAEKILKLRTDSQLSKHLHHTDVDLEKQVKYIEEYKKRESNCTEYYFAFSQLGKEEPIGFYRIYSIDYKNKAFTIGSWIFEQSTPENLPVFADILTRDFGFKQLKLDTCFFDVRKMNKKVYNYHLLFSPVFIREDEEENIFFYLQKEAFEKNKTKILRYII